MTVDRSPLQAPWDALDPTQAARVAALTAAERVLPESDTHDLILVASFILTGVVPWEDPTAGAVMGNPVRPDTWGL